MGAYEIRPDILDNLCGEIVTINKVLMERE